MPCIPDWWYKYICGTYAQRVKLYGLFGHSCPNSFTYARPCSNICPTQYFQGAHKSLWPLFDTELPKLPVWKVPSIFHLLGEVGSVVTSESIAFADDALSHANEDRCCASNNIHDEGKVDVIEGGWFIVRAACWCTRRWLRLEGLLDVLGYPSLHEPHQSSVDGFDHLGRTMNLGNLQVHFTVWAPEAPTLVWSGAVRPHLIWRACKLRWVHTRKQE